MYLDTLSPFKTDIGYGQLGMYGSLGYEGKFVQVHYPHALSAHPPSHLLFDLEEHFSCQVAINDNVSPQDAYTGFASLRDGHQVAAVQLPQMRTIQQYWRIMC